MDSLSDNEYAFTDLSNNLTNVNSSYGYNSLHNNNNSESENSLSFNYSEYIVPPEKEGSPFAACASILFKSDLKVKKKLQATPQELTDMEWSLNPQTHPTPPDFLP